MTVRKRLVWESGTGPERVGDAWRRLFGEDARSSGFRYSVRFGRRTGTRFDVFAAPDGREIVFWRVGLGGSMIRIYAPELSPGGPYR